MFHENFPTIEPVPVAQIIQRQVGPRPCPDTHNILNASWLNNIFFNDQPGLQIRIYATDILLEEFWGAENVLGLEQQGTPVSFRFLAGVAMLWLPLQV